MKYPYDLHIHSVLSPCADILMTPNNILNMAMLKGLKIIAVTDHNSTLQLLMLSELAKSYDFLFIPGVEITTRENHHILVYFRNIDDAVKFESILNQYRLPLVHPYGLASLTDVEDLVIETLPDISSEALNISYAELVSRLIPYQHILILAHVDRPNQTILEHLHQYQFDGIELTDCDNLNLLQGGLSQFTILYNSDAHDLLSISEPTLHNTIELESLSIDAFFRYFHHE